MPQALYSPMGEAALRNLGELIQTGLNQNGFYALRAAWILSTADPEGLSFTGFLRHLMPGGDPQGHSKHPFVGDVIEHLRVERTAPGRVALRTFKRTQSLKEPKVHEPDLRTAALMLSVDEQTAPHPPQWQFCRP